jgi:hypothetical protein
MTKVCGVFVRFSCATSSIPGLRIFLFSPSVMKKHFTPFPHVDDTMRVEVEIAARLGPVAVVASGT